MIRTMSTSRHTQFQMKSLYSQAYGQRSDNMCLKMSGDQEASTPSHATNNIEEPMSQEADANSNTNAGDSTSMSNKYITLRVINSDMSKEVKYRLKPTTPLVRLKLSFSNKLGMNVHVLRFIFDGYRITDYDTPEKLDMINDDCIEVYQEIKGGRLLTIE